MNLQEMYRKATQDSRETIPCKKGCREEDPIDTFNREMEEIYQKTEKRLSDLEDLLNK